MRERFGDWGAGLSDADFACALAAAGVLRDWRHLRDVEPTPELLASDIRRRLSPERSLLWVLPQLPPRLAAETLLQAWRSFRDSVGRGSFLIEIEPGQGDPRWVWAQLSRPEVGAGAVESRSQTRGRMKGSSGEGSYSIPEEGPSKRRLPFETREEPPPPPRWLQARLEALREGGSYLAVIRIGHSDARWVSVEQPFPTPEEPPEPEGHWLTVIFWEPQASPEPQVQPLLLPPVGNTAEISFPFKISTGLDRIAARITVLHANRVLQTGLLRAGTFTLDATPRTRLEGLSGRSRFDVALVLNHDDEGVARMTAAAGDQAVVVPISESSITGLTKALSDQISKIAMMPERYETLQSAGTEELLLILAQKGGGLHRSLSKLFKLDKLTQPETTGRRPCIHITSALPDSFFPAELLYRFQVPDDTASLCEHALTGLTAGACSPKCPTDKSGTVCPLGFWGLSCVIERHSYLGEHEKPSAGFHLRPEPVQKRNELEISGTALLAASDAASKHEAGAVQNLLRKLRGRGPAELVTSWKEWSARLAASRPTLLVLLPHHERKGSFEILEIGHSDPLKSELIQDIKHVRMSDKDKPIVLLMGCDTNLARIAFDNFVTRFMTEGAAIVVSTIATILGRHASPATARLIELLDEEAREGKSTFGEVMLRLRQSLVIEQTPMALGLTAYGDADWVLTRKE